MQPTQTNAGDDLSALAGIGHPYVFEGETYDVAKLSKEGEAAFERWLKEAELKAADEMGQLSPELREQALNDIRANIRAGHYRTGGKLNARSRLEPSGFAHLAYLMLKRNDRRAHDDPKRVTPELVARMIEADPEAFGVVLGEALVGPNFTTDRPTK